MASVDPHSTGAIESKRPAPTSERDGEAVEIQLVLQYRVADGRIAECWLYDQDQRLVDRFLA